MSRHPDDPAGFDPFELDPELSERFADWVDGRLDPQGLAALEAELAADADLRRRAEEYRDTVGLLRRHLQVSAEEVPAELTGGVLDRLPETRPANRLVPFLASLTTLAAMVMIYVVLRDLSGPAVREDRSAGAPASTAEGLAVEPEREGPRRLGHADPQRNGTAPDPRAPARTLPGTAPVGGGVGRPGGGKVEQQAAQEGAGRQAVPDRVAENRRNVAPGAESRTAGRVELLDKSLREQLRVEGSDDDGKSAKSAKSADSANSAEEAEKKRARVSTLAKAEETGKAAGAEDGRRNAGRVGEPGPPPPAAAPRTKADSEVDLKADPNSDRKDGFRAKAETEGKVGPKVPAAPSSPGPPNPVADPSAPSAVGGSRGPESPAKAPQPGGSRPAVDSRVLRLAELYLFEVRGPADELPAEKGAAEKDARKDGTGREADRSAARRRGSGGGRGGRGGLGGGGPGAPVGDMPVLVLEVPALSGEVPAGEAARGADRSESKERVRRLDPGRVPPQEPLPFLQSRGGAAAIELSGRARAAWLEQEQAEEELAEKEPAKKDSANKDPADRDRDRNAAGPARGDKAPDGLPVRYRFAAGDRIFAVAGDRQQVQRFFVGVRDYLASRTTVPSDAETPEKKAMAKPKATGSDSFTSAIRDRAKAPRFPLHQQRLPVSVLTRALPGGRSRTLFGGPDGEPLRFLLVLRPTVDPAAAGRSK